jgi:beta-glucosidase
MTVEETESEFHISCDVTNTGERDGAEVVQLYVSCPNGKVYRPKKELRGFTKVFLQPGETQRVRIALDDKAFRYYNVEHNAWEIEDCDYDLIIGASASDEKLRATIHVNGQAAVMSDLPTYYSADIRKVPDSEFERLLGRPIPDGKWGGELSENDAICQLYYAKTGLARLVYKILTKLKNNSEAKGKPDLNVLFIYNMPFRAIAKMAGGMVTRKMVDDILLMVNGHFFRGFGRVIVDFFKGLKASNEFKKSIGK